MRRVIGLLALSALLALPGTRAIAAASALDRCLRDAGIPRVARILGSDARPVFALVTADAGGRPTAAIPIAPGATPLARVFRRAALAVRGDPIDLALGGRICAPVELSQTEVDAEQRVIVAAGLNYAAHAEEAGGGDVFLFPKPAAPTPPYGRVHPPYGVTLLDYEVELGFVLLADVDLSAVPSRAELLANAAFFVANDVSDREPIILQASLGGPGTGFVQGKGQPGFLPAGPWMVRGTELFAALEACGADALGIRLEVDEGDGFRPRQDGSTAAMILEPRALVARIASQVQALGPRTSMPFPTPDGPRFYPLAVDASAPRLPAGSLILTGTVEGVALQAPSPLAVTLRGLLRLRSPFEQFRREELARAASGEPGGYLAPGDRVRASIDGLGAQLVTIAAPDAAAPRDPCAGE